MGIKVTTSGQVATRVWDAQAMRQFAKSVEGAVKERTFNRGVGTDGRSFRKYSSTELKLYKRSVTGRRLAPKGGVPFKWVRGPRQPGGGYDASRIGQEAGRLYPGGYAQLKRESRKGIGNAAGSGAEVDLIISGQMMRSFRVIRTGRTDATIGLTGEARIYGQHVDARRPFVGLSVADVRDMETEFAAAARGAAERSARGAH